jgi:hypothetical protein
VSNKIYTKRYPEGYVLIRYVSLTRGKLDARGTMIHRLSQPFPTYGEALAALQERERQEHLERIMVSSNE